MIADFFNWLDSTWFTWSRGFWSRLTNLIWYYSTEFTFGVILIIILLAILIYIFYKSQKSIVLKVKNVEKVFSALDEEWLEVQDLKKTLKRRLDELGDK